MKKHITWISLLLMLFLLIGGVIVINSLFTKDFAKKKAVLASEIDSINIHSEMMEIHIHPSEDEQIYTKISGKASKFSDYDVSISKKKQSIDIQTKEINAAVSAFSLNKSIALHVYLPKKEYKRISIESIFGSLYSNHYLFTDKVYFTSVLGGLHLEGFKGKKLMVDGGLGHIRINQLSGDANIKTSSGNIFVDNWSNFQKNSRIHTNKGNVQIGVTKVPNSFFLHLHSNGYVQSNLDTEHLKTQTTWKHLGMNSILGSIGQISVTTPKFEISSDTGKILLENRSGYK